jgi:hypothetical protein
MHHLARRIDNMQTGVVFCVVCFVVVLGMVRKDARAQVD